MARKFRNGWEIVGLNTRGKIREVKHKNVTDDQVARADTIYVRHIETNSYRGIHGGHDLQGIVDIIDDIIETNSPAL